MKTIRKGKFDNKIYKQRKRAKSIFKFKILRYARRRSTTTTTIIDTSRMCHVRPTSIRTVTLYLLKDGGDWYAMFLVIFSRIRKIFWDLVFVCATMADDETWLLKEDGYLNLDCECKNIIYHPNLNVVLITTGNAQVCVFDVNSGLILQRSFLSGKWQQILFIPKWQYHWNLDIDND